MPEPTKRLALCDAMMLAAMADRKTQTRRLVNPQPEWDAKAERFWWKGDWDTRGGPCAGVCTHGSAGNGGPTWTAEEMAEHARYAVGDHVALCEAFRVLRCGPAYGIAEVEYRADGSKACRKVPQSHWGRPAAQPRATFLAARYMPLWAAREFRVITRVRCQRVQDITEADAIAEGVAAHCGGFLDYDLGPSVIHAVPARYSFQTLWDSLHGAGAFNRNEWVFAYDFNRRAVPDDIEATLEGDAPLAKAKEGVGRG